METRKRGYRDFDEMRGRYSGAGNVAYIRREVLMSSFTEADAASK